jgi:hypothetical protein
VLRQFLGALAGAEEAGNLDRLDIFADEKFALLTLVTALRMRRTVAELFVDALDPHIGWLYKM